jgi:hypothetical protein
MSDGELSGDAQWPGGTNGGCTMAARVASTVRARRAAAGLRISATRARYAPRCSRRAGSTREIVLPW